MNAIGFACSANLCRSPMAHAILATEVARRGLPVRVLSAGVSPGFEGMLAIRQARLTCERHNTPMPKFISTHMSNTDFSRARRLFVMEAEQAIAVLNYTTLPPDRISLLGDFDPHCRGPEIEDPMGQDSAAFEHCYARLRDCIVHYLDTTHDLDPPSAN
jgi:protein-tyrosine phosphatase